MLPNPRGKINADGTRKLLKLPRPQTLFDILDKAHKELNHGGCKKLETYIHRRYYGISRTLIMTYLQNCHVCQVKTAL